MGNTINNVNENLLKMGFPTIEEYKEENEYEESGSPDYLYEFKVIL